MGKEQCFVWMWLTYKAQTVLAPTQLDAHLLPSCTWGVKSVVQTDMQAYYVPQTYSHVPQLARLHEENGAVFCCVLCWVWYVAYFSAYAQPNPSIHIQVPMHVTRISQLHEKKNWLVHWKLTLPTCPAENTVHITVTAGIWTEHCFIHSL